MSKKASKIADENLPVGEPLTSYDNVVDDPAAFASKVMNDVAETSADPFKGKRGGPRKIFYLVLGKVRGATSEDVLMQCKSRRGAAKFVRDHENMLSRFYESSRTVRCKAVEDL